MAVPDQQSTDRPLSKPARNSNETTPRVPRIAVRRLLTSCCVLACLTLVACNQPRPRTFTEFVEDAAAREGTLVRCNADRDASANDLECANARRAAASVALDAERARRAELEAESDRLRSELRDRTAQQQDAERRAEALRRAMLQAAYEAQWVDPDDPDATPELEVPPGLFDAPVGNPAEELFGAPRGADGQDPGNDD